MVPSWFLSNMSKAALKASNSSGRNLSVILLSSLSFVFFFLFDARRPRLIETDDRSRVKAPKDHAVKKEKKREDAASVGSIVGKGE